MQINIKKIRNVSLIRFIEYIFAFTESVWAVLCCRGLWDFCETDGTEEHRATAAGPGHDHADAGGSSWESQGWESGAAPTPTPTAAQRAVWSTEWGWDP